MKVRTMSRVPDLTENAHPVAPQDFRYVDGRMATLQFRLEEMELLYLVEIRDVLGLGLLVDHMVRINE